MSSKRLLRTSKYFCAVSILEFFQTNFRIHIVLLSISGNVKRIWILLLIGPRSFYLGLLLAEQFTSSLRGPATSRFRVPFPILRNSSGTWTKKQIFKISKRKQKKRTQKQFSPNSLENSQSLSHFVSRFVLYQLSKNLNRPFFVDFLTHLSIRYTEQGGKLDDEDPEETGDIYSEIYHCLGYFPDHSCCQQYNQCSLIIFVKLSFISPALIG